MFPGVCLMYIIYNNSVYDKDYFMVYIYVQEHKYFG